MSLEPKSQKLVESNKPSLSNFRASDSPERCKARTEVNRADPSSPRYRSPIHTRVGPEPSEHHNCPTCEKRSQDPIQVKYHESPPKVRPSHHNIVCEDCSEGSFSQVLKVLHLNEGSELSTGTKKIKIIESTPAISASSSFPIIGQGKTVQVLYQEVYPPPKPELTSLLPENLRENGILKFTLKDEERKRVAIRRAEYANRIKGITKTVVTTISPADRSNRRERLSVDIEEFESFGEGNDERFVKSEKKICKVKDVKDEKDEKRVIAGEEGKIKEGLVGKADGKGNLEDFQCVNRKDQVLIGKEMASGDKKGKSDLKKISYFEKIQELSSGKSETNKISVKQKILAKLAGKDFKSLIEKIDRNEESEESDQELEELKENYQETDLKQQSINSNTLKPTLPQVNSPESPLNPTEPVLNPANPEHNRPLSSSNSAFDSEEVDSTHYNSLFDKTGKQEVFSNRTFGKTVKSGDNSERSHPDPYADPYPDPDNEDSEVPHEYSKTSKFSSPILSDTFHYDRISPQTEDYESPTFPVQSQPDLDQPSKLVENCDKIIENSDKQIEKSHDSNSGSEEISTQSVYLTLPVKSDLPELPEVPEDKPQVKTFTLDLIPTFDDQAEHESLSSGTSSRRADKEERPDDQILDTKKATPQGLFNTGDKNEQLSPGHSKSGSKETEKEDFSTLLQIEKLNQIFSILADPKVVKGLRLLGGFSDYLEKHGKEVLDWKL